MSLIETVFRDGMHVPRPNTRCHVIRTRRMTK